jgi:hypothetical protein
VITTELGIEVEISELGSRKVSGMHDRDSNYSFSRRKYSFNYILRLATFLSACDVLVLDKHRMHPVVGQRSVVLNMARLMTEPSSVGVDVAPSPTLSAAPLRTGIFTCEPKRPPPFPLTSCNYATK